ncbi:MAG: DNA helicase RecQ [Runella slithyformis]|nr:MAG: DNA helicase RecQ [Runella slithyformis]
MTKEQVLKQYFGYDTFRPLQADIIDTILRNEDCMVLMPTGGGKSLCFQVPALLKEGLTVVLSPLIALMKDQVEALRGNGVGAAYLNSSLSQQEQDSVLWKCKLGELKLLYVAPERLFSQNTLRFLQDLQISLFAIDESHCISAWGHDFRPEYRQLSILKREFPQVPIVALTATADRVTRRDILKQLGIVDAPVFLASFDRPNLSLTVLPGLRRTEQIKRFVSERPKQPGIVYCLSRKGTESVCEGLQKAGISAAYYHAGMSSDERSRAQERFLRDDVQVMVATVAFGMGIDKSNIRWVIHYNLPSNVESFYQEIGRAGRDGLPADTVLFYSFSDFMMRQEMITKSESPQEQKEVLEAKLNRIKQYAEADICRRRILLSYFNENVEKDCGNCDVCRNPRSKFDATLIAQKALSGIARTRQNVAMGMLIDILRGSRNQNILRQGYDKLPTFGVGKDLRGEQWADYLSQLLNSGIIDIAYDEGHAFKLNDKSWDVLKNGLKVDLVQFVSGEERKARQEELAPKEKTKKEVIKDAMFERLRTLRKQISDKLDLPPFVIFSDATLSEMAQRRPISEAQMKAISGVGDEKYKRYGKAFIDEIVAFARENNQTGTRVAVKGLTYLDTLELYEQGLDLQSIAETRNLNAGTIVGHLVKLKAEGHDIDFWRFIRKQEYEAIMEAARAVDYQPNTAVAPIFDYLNQHYDYGIIRLALAIGEKT